MHCTDTKKPTGNANSTAGCTDKADFATTVHRVKPLALVATKMEPRVDSRLLAQHLGNQHRPTMALIEKHLPPIAAQVNVSGMPV